MLAREEGERRTPRLFPGAPTPSSLVLMSGRLLLSEVGPVLAKGQPVATPPPLPRPAQSHMHEFDMNSHPSVTVNARGQEIAADMNLNTRPCSYHAPQVISCPLPW